MKVDLCLDSYVASSAGPILCEEIAAGTELVIVGRDGRLGTGVVEAIADAREGEFGQLLTAVGDIKVPCSSTIVTRRGFERVGELAAAAPGSTRIELVSPADLPRPHGRRPLRKADVISALHSFETPVIMIPAVRSDLDDLVASIEGYLSKAGSQYEVVESERWVNFVFMSDAPTRPGDLQAEADILSILTAWTNEDGSMRTRVSDDRVRRHLIAGLVAKGIAPAVQWVPAYRPAECIVTEQAKWSPFSALHSVRMAEGPIIRIEISGAGRVVCGLAIVGSGA
jgi:hypothetical protein